MAVVFAAVPALCAAFACAPELPARDQSTTLRVKRGSLGTNQLLTGELVAESSVEISVPDVGIRPLEIRWMVENGTGVAAGDPLFELDNTDLATRLDASRSTVLEARSRIATAESEAGAKVAEAEFQLAQRRAALEKARIDASIPAGVRSPEEYQRLQLELQKAQRMVDDAGRLLRTASASATAGVDQQRLELDKNAAQLRQVENGIASLAVTAPIPGVALVRRNTDLDRPWEVGDVVYPGHRLAELPDLSTLVVRARLFDVDDGKLEPGMRATVELDPHPGVHYGARVRAIDRIAFQRDRDGSTRVFWVTLDLDSLDLERMRAGMSVRVAIDRTSGNASGGESPAILLAPRASLDLSNPAEPRARLASGSWRRVSIGACGPLDCVVQEGLDEGAELGRAVSRNEGS